MASFVQDMCITHGRADVLVAKEFRDSPDVVACIKQMGSKGMPVSLGKDPLPSPVLRGVRVFAVQGVASGRAARPSAMSRSWIALTLLRWSLSGKMQLSVPGLGSLNRRACVFGYEAFASKRYQNAGKCRFFEPNIMSEGLFLPVREKVGEKLRLVGSLFSAGVSRRSRTSLKRPFAYQIQWGCTRGKFSSERYGPFFKTRFTTEVGCSESTTEMQLVSVDTIPSPPWRGRGQVRGVRFRWSPPHPNPLPQGRGD
jgi:hypothetical protein